MVVLNWPLPANMRADVGEPGNDNGNGTVHRPVMFVASGDLFWYTSTPVKEEGNVILGRNAGWQKEIGIPPRPAGRIIDIAATQNNLYILVMIGTGVNTTIFRLESGGRSGWSDPITLGTDNNIQSIFADSQGRRLFVGAQSERDNSIWYLDEGTNTPRQLQTGSRMLLDEPTSDTGLLSGVVYQASSDPEQAGTYFLSTRNDGIFEVGSGWRTGNSITMVGTPPNRRPRSFMGMISLPDGTIIAVARDGGFLYEVHIGHPPKQIPDSSASADEFMRTGRDATSALALWREGTVNDDGVFTAGRTLLVVGIQGSRQAATFTNGYVEFELLSTENGTLRIGPRREAGTTNDLLSVSDSAQYRASLGRLPLNHLFQVPTEVDESMTFFASTQTAGLWSFRTINRVPQWNAEHYPRED